MYDKRCRCFYHGKIRECREQWLPYLERLVNDRIPTHIMKYDPKGRWDVGRHKTRWNEAEIGHKPIREVND